jgi:hypothetical protein
VQKSQCLHYPPHSFQNNRGKFSRLETISLAPFISQIRSPSRRIITNMVAQSNSFSSASSNGSLSSESNSEAPLPPDFLSQSLRAFKEWPASLDKRSDRFQGNFVAIPKIDSKTGIVSIAEAKVFNTGETGPDTQVSLGVKGTMSKFVHGSIIALYNPTRNRFLKMTTLRASAR